MKTSMTSEMITMYVIVAVVAVSTGSVASAGTGRHDDLDGVPGNEPDEHVYIEYGNNYPNVGGFHVDAAGTIEPSFFGSGVLIDSTHVLTAAHVAADFLPSGHNFRIGNNDYRTSSVTLYPGYDSSTMYADLAVIQLSRPVIGVTPATLYTGTNEVGQDIDIAGYGLGGTGEYGYQENTSKKRAGQNVIDGLGDNTTFGSIFETTFPNDTLLYDFDKPAALLNPMGSNTSRALEYHQAGGDSGGGWFVDVAGDKRLVGVASYIKDLGVPSGVPYGDGFSEGKYYEIGVASRVTAYQSWISDTVQASASDYVYYPFNGNAKDYGNNGYDGAVVGASLCPDRFGNADGAYDFSGNDYIVAVPISAESSASFAAWVKLDSAGDGGFIIIKGEHNTKETYSIAVTEDSSLLQARIHIGNSYIIAESDESLVLDRWTHVAGVYDGQSLILYVDGVLADEVLVSGSLYQNSKPLYFGVDYDNWSSAANWEGGIDDVFVSNWAMSQDDIVALIPEPTTMAFLVLGGLTLLRRRN